MLSRIVPAHALDLPERRPPEPWEVALELLDGWTPPPEDVDELEESARFLSVHLYGHEADEDEGISTDTLREWRSAYAPADDAEAREWKARSIAGDVLEVARIPGRHSWRRWRATRKLAGWLYASGITSSGGSASASGRDPYGWVYELPRLRSFRPGPRCYLLWISREERECFRAQVHFARRGSAVPIHRPGAHQRYGLCAICWPEPE